MLHIHNGDCSAEIGKRSTLPGEHFAWREALSEGPTPANLIGEEWRHRRARHLAESYGEALNETERELRAQEEKLAAYTEHDEVVLWFEHDLFCQINLLYLLDWFAQHDLGQTKISLIFVGEFPGLSNFRGLGELNPEQMASLFPGRGEVSAAQLNLATRAWTAYCSNDPTAVEQLLETDTFAMPFLKRALDLHLERYPFVSNGLNRIQNRGLQLISGGLRRFADLFPRFGDAEPYYGLGDAQFWISLRQMSNASQPLLNTNNGDLLNGKLTPEKVQHTTFEITEIGAEVLNAQADFVELNGVDTWLGGVHLSGKTNFWRWDDQKHRLVFI